MTGLLSRPWAAAVFGATATLALASMLIVGLSYGAYVAPGPRVRSSDPQGVTVVLRKGSGLTEIGATLRRARVIGSEPLFLAAAQLTGAARRLKPGEYRFAFRASLRDVIRRIRQGDVLRHRITIAEGLTSDEAIETLARSDVLAGATPPSPPEGALLPETYEVLRGESRAAVLQRMIEARDRLLAQLWSHRQAGLPYDGVEAAVTLASIVEKETAIPAERPRVAAVYLNRLRTGMNLDADPTLIYGVSKGRPLGRGLTAAELQAPGPYNTYLQPGLPPTPIDNPGRATLAAVMDPAKTQELYFVADGSGGHAFSTTLAEQSRHVARWRRLERERRDALGPTAPREHR